MFCRNDKGNWISPFNLICFLFLTPSSLFNSWRSFQYWLCSLAPSRVSRWSGVISHEISAWISRRRWRDAVVIVGSGRFSLIGWGYGSFVVIPVIWVLVEEVPDSSRWHISRLLMHRIVQGWSNILEIGDCLVKVMDHGAVLLNGLASLNYR